MPSFSISIGEAYFAYANGEPAYVMEVRGAKDEVDEEEFWKAVRKAYEAQGLDLDAAVQSGRE